MVIEMGGVKCFVKKIYPRTSLPKICDEFIGINCDDASYPLKQIFLGEHRATQSYKDQNSSKTAYRSAQSIYEDSLKDPKPLIEEDEDLNDFQDIWIKKADYTVPDDLFAT